MDKLVRWINWAGFISADRLLITQPKARIYELQYSILNSGNSAVPAGYTCKEEKRTWCQNRKKLYHR